MPAHPSAVETEGLLKRFAGVKALDRLTMSLPSKGITSIIGPNGSGKSTLVNVLTGTLPIDGGIVVLQGERLRMILPHDSPAHGLTRTFQEVRLFEQITVMDNLLVVLTERGVFKSLFERAGVRHKQRARQLLELVGLCEKQDALAENLSYGQRKLLEVCRALAMGVQIYLFDEPFAGLYSEMVKQVKALLVQLRKEGCAVILIEHNMGLIRELSDYMFVLDSGELLAEGQVDEVFAREDVIEAYLGR